METQEDKNKQKETKEQIKSFEKEIKAFQPLMSSLGHGHIKLASNEWNVAPAPSFNETPSKFESALMVSEMFSQYIDANLFMANFWGVHRPKAKAEIGAKPPNIGRAFDYMDFFFFGFSIFYLISINYHLNFIRFMA